MSRPTLVVFAAGRGTRLRPLTDRLPKAMMPVLDVPLVDLALARGDSVEWAGRIVNLSVPAPGLAEHLQAKTGVTLFDEGAEPFGTAATLRRLIPRLGDTVVTYNCDMVSDLEISELLESHAGTGKPCTLAVQAVERGADLTSDGDLRLIDRRLEDRPGFLFLGAAVFERGLLEAIPPTEPLGLVAGLLAEAVEQQQVALFEHAGYARDGGSLDRYLQVNLDALDPSSRFTNDIPGTVSPDGWYMGSGAQVEPDCLGRGAVVLAGARVGAGCSLSSCVVWPGSVVPQGTVCEGGIWFEGRFLTV